jgi:hypothetical protein
MSIKGQFLRRFAASAVAVTLGAGLVGVAATPAFAISCTLSIGSKNTSGFYPVFVGCTQVASIGGFALWGQDEVFDEFRQSFPGNVATVDPAVLNEDDSIFNREDDIYAKVSGVDAGGTPFSLIMTNVIHREF